MGNILSLECIEGQAATGKTSFILKEIQRGNEKKDRDQYCYVFSDPGNHGEARRKRTHFFVRNEDEDPAEWGVCPLDASQSGITHAYWMDLIGCMRNPSNKNKTRVLIDRSPLSHMVYEYFWKRMFPVIRDTINKDRSIDLWDIEVDAGWALIRRAFLNTERGRGCLEHFREMILRLMKEMEEFARTQGVDWLIYLSFDDFIDQYKHECADERRNGRGGFDRFPASPIEGDRTELCEKLYCPGESLLWQAVWDVYHMGLKPKRNHLQIFRLNADDEGLIFDEEEKGDKMPILRCLAHDMTMSELLKEDDEIDASNNE